MSLIAPPPHSSLHSRNIDRARLRRSRLPRSRYEITAGLLAGLLTSGVWITSSAQTVTTYQYDALGRVTEASMDTGGTETFEYDDASNITRAIGTPAATGSPPSCTYLLRLSFGPTYAIDGTTNCTDPDADPLTVLSVTDPVGPASTSLSGNIVTFTNLQPGQTAEATVTITDGNGHYVTNVIGIGRP